MKIFQEKNKNTFCPGCGNLLIYAALRNALIKENIKQKDAVFVFDVGCSGNYADKINARTVHTLHGRSLPFGCGLKIANPKKMVIINCGDGAIFHEGISHLIEAAKNNWGVILIVHNNDTFALTKGQKIAKDESFGINLMKQSGVKFAHLIESSDLKKMTEVFQKAFKQNGFCYIEIKQSCPTFNR